ncbi:hypothetical protein BC832DRAFT_594773 [Gaertneriomyces semiglobifer]|nr:hypothetical protein BC832DRAFT_594773 [Gaertneriomyces semiglobifer]
MILPSWDDLSDEWNEAEAHCLNRSVKLPTPVTNPDMSTVVIAHDKHIGDGGIKRQSFAPIAEGPDLKDIFSPLSLEKLFKHSHVVPAMKPEQPEENELLFTIKGNGSMVPQPALCTDTPSELSLNMEMSLDQSFLPAEKIGHLPLADDVTGTFSLTSQHDCFENGPSHPNGALRSQAVVMNNSTSSLRTNTPGEISAKRTRCTKGSQFEDREGRKEAGGDSGCSSWSVARLFQTEYDGRTRSHLRALVNEVASGTTDGVSEVGCPAVYHSGEGRISRNVSVDAPKLAMESSVASYHNSGNMSRQSIMSEGGGGNRHGSYPSDIDFLEDPFDSKERSSFGSSLPEDDRVTEQGHLADTSKSAHAASSRMLTIRNLNFRASAASAMLSQLGAHSRMVFNEEKQCWEGSDDAFDCKPPAEVAIEERQDEVTSIVRPVNQGVIARGATEVSLKKAEETASDSQLEAEGKKEIEVDSHVGEVDENSVVHHSENEALEIFPGLASTSNIDIAEATERSSPLDSPSIGVINRVANEDAGAAFIGVSSSASDILLDLRSSGLSSTVRIPPLWNLRVLDVSQNAIRDLKALTPLANLKELRAEANQIMDCGFLRYMPRLAKACLRANRITALRVSSGEQCRLEILDVSYNRLKNLEGIEHFEHLRELTVDHNKLESITTTTPLPRVEILSAAHNNLSHFDAHFWPNVQALDLDGNLISSMSNEKLLTQLRTLSLEFQRVDRMSVRFAYFQDLRSLRVSDCPLHDLEQLCYNNQLRTLDARAAGVKRIPDIFGMSLPNLEYLDLTQNGILNTYGIKYLKGIRSLYLTGNDIQDFAMLLASLKGLSKIEVLDLRFNPITAKFYPHPESYEGIATWDDAERKFRQALSDQDYVRRACYRSTIICSLRGSLKRLDQLATDDKHKRIAKYHMKKLKSSLRQLAQASQLS